MTAPRGAAAPPILPYWCDFLLRDLTLGGQVETFAFCRPLNRISGEGYPLRKFRKRGGAVSALVAFVPPPAGRPRLRGGAPRPLPFKSFPAPAFLVESGASALVVFLRGDGSA